MKLDGKWWVAGLLAASMALTGACGGGGDDAGDDGASADVEAEVDADATANEDTEASGGGGSESFDCPVTLADVEEAFAPVQFGDAEPGPESCTFKTEDGVGSVVVSVDPDAGEAGYKSIIALTAGEGEAVEGVGDEARYSSARTMLIARKGEAGLTVMAAATLGVGGAQNANSEELRENIEQAVITLGKKAAAAL